MRAPVIDSPEVEPGAVPGVRAQAIQDPGAPALAQGVSQLGQGIQDTGDVLTRLAQREQRRANAVAAANQFTQLKHDTTPVLYGAQASDQPTTEDPNAAKASPDGTAPAAAYGPSQKAAEAAFNGTEGLSSRGVLMEQGQRASQYVGPALQWLDGHAKELEEALPNDEAKALFRKMAGAHLVGVRDQVYRHAGEQAEVADKASLHATTAAVLGNIASNYADDADVERQLSALEPMIDHMALSPEDAADKKASVRQQAYAAVVGQYVADKDADGAQAKLALHKDAIAYGKDGAEKLRQLEHTVGVLKDQQTGQQLGSKLVSDATDPGGVVNAASAISGFQKLSPEQQRIAEPAFTKSLRLAQEADRAQASDLYTAMSGQWVKSHSMVDVDPALISRATEIDPEGLYRLQQRDAQWKKEQQPRGAKDDSVSASQLNRGRILAQMATDPDSILKMDDATFERSFAHLVNGKDYTVVSTARAELLKKANAPDKDTSPPAIALTTIKTLGGQNGAKVWNETQPASRWTPDQVDTFALAQQKAADYRATYKAAHHGAEPKAEDYQQALSPLFRKETIQKPWYRPDVETTRIQSEASQDQKDGIFTTPENVRPQLKAKLQTMGIDPTPENVDKAYTALARKGEDLPPPKLTATLTATAPDGTTVQPHQPGMSLKPPDAPPPKSAAAAASPAPKKKPEGKGSMLKQGADGKYRYDPGAVQDLVDSMKAP